jgi:mono/diheme cytochrome c family protein
VRQFFFYSIFIIALVVSSCNGEKSSNSNQNAIEDSEESSSLNDAEPVVESHPGKAVYQKYCLTCHQADGSGVPGMFPPLSPNEWIADKDKMIDLMMNGQSGKITVNGEVYNNLMPAHDFLSDQEIADVISYVRSSFGNDLAPVSTEEVEAAR